VNSLIDGLLRPLAYPHPVDQVELKETPISWVLLAGAYAYKIRRPVKLDFVDFSTLEARRQDCFEEIRLNRHFAPQLYESVVPIRGDEQQPVIGATDADGPAVEYAVKMQRFPAGQELSTLLECNAVSVDELVRFGSSLAAIHARLDECRDPSAAIEVAMQNVRELQQARPRDDSIGTLAEWMEKEWRRIGGLAAHRAGHGRVRECHGDLHAANIVRLDGQLVAFDCLEFDARLRCIDVASDVAFLFMDLQARGQRSLAYALLNAWLEAGGDYEAVGLLRFFAVHRALVRAKVTQLARDAAHAVQYQNLAVALTKPTPARLSITCGLSGSGKTWFSEQAVTRCGVIRIRSDVERKRMADLQAGQRSVGETLYTPQFNERVYAHLLEAARTMLTSGESVIVDAAFLRRDERLQYRQLADELQVDFRIFHCIAPDATLRSRLDARSRAGTDASEADIAVMERQHHWWEGFGDERSHVIEVRTAEPDSVEQALQSVPRS